MKPIQTTAKFTFIRGGLSKENKPYLNVSNGRSAMYITIPKALNVTDETFAQYNEDDEIELKVNVRVGETSVSLVELPVKK